jgi:hypothetical protein
MKKLVLFILVSGIAGAYGQNEFAATSFYSIFRRIQTDAGTGFTAYKGAKLKTAAFEEVNQQYKVKLMLPLADSGRIIVPVSGNPYALYFFEPEKHKDKIDERAANLRDAVATAFGKPLYVKTTSTTVDSKVFSDIYLYDNAEETHASRAVFRINIFYENEKYRLLLEIRGKSQ